MDTSVFLASATDRREGTKAAFLGFPPELQVRIKGATSLFLLMHLCHPERQLASVHIDAVRGALDALRALTKAPIVLGDGSHYGTKSVWRNLGFEHLLSEYQNVSFIDLNEDAWTSETITLSDGTAMDIHRAKTPREASVRLALVPMKTHRVFTATLSVLDWVLGTWQVPSRASARGAVFAREPFLLARPEEAGKIITDLYTSLPCDGAVIEAVTAMEGKGPVEGSLVEMGAVLSSKDLFALDAVASTLMGIDPGEVSYLAEGSLAGLGLTDVGKINVPPALLAEKTRTFLR